MDTKQREQIECAIRKTDALINKLQIFKKQLEIFALTARNDESIAQIRETVDRAEQAANNVTDIRKATKH